MFSAYENPDAFRGYDQGNNQEYDDDDDQEISADLLGFNMNTLFENKGRRKKVHMKRTKQQLGRHLGWTMVHAC